MTGRSKYVPTEVSELAASAAGPDKGGRRKVLFGEEGPHFFQCIEDALAEMGVEGKFLHFATIQEKYEALRARPGEVVLGKHRIGGELSAVIFRKGGFGSLEFNDGEAIGGFENEVRLPGESDSGVPQHEGKVPSRVLKSVAREDPTWFEAFEFVLEPVAALHKPGWGRAERFDGLVEEDPGAVDELLEIADS